MNIQTIYTVVNTKGGVGKTSLCANLGAYLADVCAQRVLLVDADVQPTLSSYFPLQEAPRAGVSEWLLRGTVEGVISRTVIPNLDLIVSNDDYGELNTRLLHAVDGRLRLRKMLFKVAAAYDVVLIDTQGARTVLTEAAVIAADRLLSPIVPQILAAREFLRGTVSMLSDLGAGQHLLHRPRLSAVLNAVDGTVDSREIAKKLRQEVFAEADPARYRLLDTVIPALVAYKEAATLGRPVHCYEPTRPRGRKTLCAAEVIAALAGELFAPAAGDLFTRRAVPL